MFKYNNRSTRTTSALLLLTLNRFQRLIVCFHCWLLTSKCWLNNVHECLKLNPVLLHVDIFVLSWEGMSLGRTMFKRYFRKTFTKFFTKSVKVFLKYFLNTLLPRLIPPYDNIKISTWRSTGFDFSHATLPHHNKRYEGSFSHHVETNETPRKHFFMAVIRCAGTIIPAFFVYFGLGMIVV